MKKLILWSAALLCNIAVFGQNGTTIDEYNYLTKGLKIQSESGLDKKVGYRMDLIYSREFNDYKFEISNFVFVESSDLRAMSIKIFSPITKKTYYVCVPVNNDVLVKQNFEYTSLFTPELSKAYAAALGDCLTKTSLGFMDLHKTSGKPQ